MPVMIHGKEYFTVAERMGQLVKNHKQDYSLKTNVTEEGEYVRCKAVIVLYNNQQEREFHGSAEEVRGSSQINTTSAWENCETSAIGRALSAAGYSGHEYASANEVQNAVAQQKEVKKTTKKAPNTASKASKDKYATTGQRELLKELLGTKQVPEDKAVALTNLVVLKEFPFDRAEKAIEYMGSLSEREAE